MRNRTSTVINSLQAMLSGIDDWSRSQLNGGSLLLLLALLLAGCAGGALIVYPDATQDTSVEKTTRRGYTLLQSTKGPTSVTVRLQGATNAYVQSFVTIANNGSAPLTVVPESIRVVTIGSRTRTFSAYAPEEVPNVVRQSARSSRLDLFSAESGGLQGAEEKQADETVGYGRSNPVEEQTYLDLMLRSHSIAPQSLARGLVYTPFSRDIERFRLKIPVGSETHVFEFTVETVDG